MGLRERDVVRRNAWGRRRVQLGGALLLAVAVPFVIAMIVSPGTRDDALFEVSATGSGIAVVLGYYFYRSLIGFPGIRASTYVFPVFTSTFAAAFAGFLLLRLEYSRPLLIATYLLALAWFLLVYYMIQRRQRLEIAVVPFGRADTMYRIDQVVWHRLESPALPAGCSTVTADFHYDLPPEWEEFLADCALRGVSVLHYKQLRQSLTGQVEIEHLSENSYGSLIPSSPYIMLKAVGDFILAVAALPVLVPVFVVTAIAIKLDSPGPVFFRQQRMGYRGQLFTVWKFRTMAHAPRDASDRGGAMTQAGDQRVTRLGRFLRRSRIDELAQVINVLRGEMSWIGPRPEAEVLSRWYQSEIPFYRYRHIVRPGISGWAQVNQGHVAELDDVWKKLNFDFFYISNFSFWLDVLIVFRTLKTALTGFGAR